MNTCKTVDLTKWLNANVGKQLAKYYCGASVTVDKHKLPTNYFIQLPVTPVPPNTNYHFPASRLPEDVILEVKQIEMLKVRTDYLLCFSCWRCWDLLWLLFVPDNYISDIEQFDLKSLSSSLETLILAGNSLTSVPEGKTWAAEIDLLHFISPLTYPKRTTVNSSPKLR